MHQPVDAARWQPDFLDGTEITARGYEEDKVCQQIGMVFQNFLLFNHLTVLDNVMIGLTKVRKMSKEQSKTKANV